MQAELEQSENLSAQIAEQEEQAAAAAAELNAVQSELAELTTRRDAMQADLNRSESLAAQIAEQEERAAALQTQIETLSTDLAAQQADPEQAAAPEQPTDAPAEPAPVATQEPAADAQLAVTGDDGSALQPRDADQVSAILATTPGLPQSQASRDRLRDLLVEGQCTIDALREVQNPINRQALLVLLAGLDGC